MQDALTAGRTRPGRLTVEVTESDLFADVDAALQAVNAVRRLGCQVALDDFGVGHSSLSRLLEPPADVLKVDRAFIRTVPGDPGAEAVLAAVLALGRDLARTVVVEGVETATTLHALRDAGVRYAQGYYFTAALPAGEPQHPAPGGDHHHGLSRRHAPRRCTTPDSPPPATTSARKAVHAAASPKCVRSTAVSTPRGSASGPQVVVATHTRPATGAPTTDDGDRPLPAR
ncbi:hypothetical protein GCM10025868_19300 [Angustibacter aerolatus]|uniref:EAL domain-containing protein n=1 Tax=Angustibacter aerolatus TaxID=1162965 RepID=A0ABQ6JIM8_9ACTN|nr:EAL domain-containing protein [Angustibacter aerolatus]GMA86680.1 hypothetical protein GCM10025868_19300 [Angustibacter aerolatus]